MCICVNIYIYICIYIYIYTCIHAYVHINICVLELAMVMTNQSNGSQGFPGFHNTTTKITHKQWCSMFFIKEKRKPYIVQWCSMFFHSKSMKLIQIPMVFKMFEVLGSLGKQVSKCGGQMPSRLPRGPKPRKPLESVWFSLIFGKPLEYVWLSFLRY